MEANIEIILANSRAEMENGRTRSRRKKNTPAKSEMCKICIKNAETQKRKKKPTPDVIGKVEN